MGESQPKGPAPGAAVKNAAFLKNVRFSSGPLDPRDLESGLGDRLLEIQTGSVRKQEKQNVSAGRQEKQTVSVRKKETVSAGKWELSGRLLEEQTGLAGRQEKQTGSARKQESPGRHLEKRTGSARKPESPGWERARVWGTVIARICLVLSMAFVLTYLLLMVLGHRIF